MSQGTRGEDVDWQMDQANATGRTEVADLIGHKVDTEYAMNNYTDHQHTLPTSGNLLQWPQQSIVAFTCCTNAAKISSKMF